MAGRVTFEKSRIITFSSLSEKEKESYMDFLVDNDVQFFKEKDGSYAANIRLCTAALAASNEAKAKEGAAGNTRQRRRSGGSRSSVGSQRSRQSRASRRGSRRRGVGAASSIADFNYSAYPKFCSLISARDSLRPKTKSLTWLMRWIEELYDVRYARDTADINGDEGDEAVSNDTERISSVFPVFVVEFFSKRYGLRSLVEQMCWDLLYNVHRLRKDSLEVQIFSRFLEEFYDADDLLFFLHVRSVVQKELGINFRSDWSELSRHPERNPRTTFLSHRECQLVSRAVFGSETDPLFKAFMNVVERHVVGQRRGKSDTRRVEVMQFLHLALSEYHAMSPADGAAGDGGGVPGEGGMGAPAVISSREEQERLFREAEAQYNESIRNAQSDDEATRESRIKAMEASLRSQVASGPVGASSPGVAYPSSPATPNQPTTPASSGAAAGASAPPASSTPAVPDRALLQQLGQAMHRANEEYLARVMQPGKSLPDALFEQIKEEVRAELESKVDGVLAGVINKTGAGVAADVASDPLASMFRDVLAGGGARNVTVQEFAGAVVESEEVRHDIEPLVVLLFTYANSRIEEKGGKGKQ